MSASRFVKETLFSIQLLPWHQQEFTLLGQSGYALIQQFSLAEEKTHPLSTYLLNPHETCRIEQLQTASTFLILRFAPQLFIELATRMKLSRSGSHLLFSPLMTIDLKLTQALEALHHEVLHQGSGWREVVTLLLNQIAVYLLRSHMTLQRSEELEFSRIGIVDRRLRRAIEFMHDNCERELTLAEISAAVYISEFHFARLFKKITGTTPHHYLAALRLELAQKLLIETDLSIIEIGARVGYNSQSHFTKIFREATGLTPHLFRETATKNIGKR